MIIYKGLNLVTSINFLVESIKNRFLSKKESYKGSLPENDIHSEINLTNDEFALGFFDDGMKYLNIFDNKDNVTKQASLIKEYRRIAAYPEVSDAIDEIINEMTFIPNNSCPLYIDFESNSLSQNIENVFQSIFNLVMDKLNINVNIDTLCRRFYIDGQLILAISYDEKSKNIESIRLMDPCYLVHDHNKNIWFYVDNENMYYENKTIYNSEEIIFIDSGLYSNGLVLSHLHNVIKVVNQLSTLEDLMVPLRYSRSVSRRVFNIDVGNLPYEKAISAVEDIRNKFRYKKYYNTETGEINNNASVQSMVEDYFFPNRGQSKGTQVDVLDETGNLGETGDLEYFKNKLYNSLKVPMNRIVGDNRTIFDFNSTQIESTELKFYAFVCRLRRRFLPIITEIMKRIMIYGNYYTNYEYEKYVKYISIGWVKESNFLERQNLDILKQRLETYEAFKNYQGDIFSKEYLLKNILKLTDEEINDMREEIVKEGSEDDSFGDEDLDNEDLDGNKNIDNEDIDDNDDNLSDNEDLDGNKNIDDEDTKKVAGNKHITVKPATRLKYMPKNDLKHITVKPATRLKYMPKSLDVSKFKKAKYIDKIKNNNFISNKVIYTPKLQNTERIKNEIDN